MAPIGTIIGPTENQRNYKARIVAKYLGLELETTPNFNFGVDNKTPEYLAKFPCGKVPTYDGADGFTLTDSSAIAYYVASKAGSDSPLLGKTAEETAEILQYILFAEADFSPAHAGVMYPLLGYRPFVQPAFQAAEQDMTRFLDALNTMLVDKTYLVGERLTIADIIVACDLIMLFQFYLTAEDRKTYRNVARYFKTISGQAAFKAVSGDIELCT
ncbi:translation elongation factor activity protein, partial [Coemansia sp. RSA 2399]